MSRPTTHRLLNTLSSSRSFHTTPTTHFPPPKTPQPILPEAVLKARANQTKRKGRGQGKMKDLTPNDFGDTTTLGYLRLMVIKEAKDLVAKVVDNDKILRAQSVPFVPPKQGIRVTSIHDLTYPNHRVSMKCAILVPVSTLPLKSADAIHRFKLLAGTRWSPGRPGRFELQEDGLNRDFNAGEERIGREGWIKMSEDRFETFRMNRKGVSDILERLVEASNDPNSPLPADIPLDLRHLHARERRRPGLASFRRAEIMRANPQVVGKARGYPLEWLSEEHAEKFRNELSSGKVVQSAQS